MQRKPKGAALITGSAQRIGRHIALHLHDLGFAIALHYHHSHREAQNLADEIRKRKGLCKTFKCDLSHPRAVNQLFLNVFTKFPDLNVLVNNASIFEPSSLRKADLNDFNREFAINVRAPYVLMSAFSKYIRTGSIINILDTKINQSQSKHLSYLLAKKSLSELTRMAAVELAPGIRVNAVAPGLILPPKSLKNGYLERLAKNIPLKRKGEPADISQAVQFLLENGYITGQTIFVDGGEHLI